MRTNWFAGVLFVGALSMGCAVNSQQGEDEQASVQEAAASIADKLAGDYVSADSLSYPTLNLATSPRTYTWDTGIRCIKAPCPSLETGRWSVYRGIPSGRLYLGLFASGGKEHWFQIDFDGTGATKGLIGVWGEATKFVPKRVTDPCAVVRCAAGTHCEATDGRAACVPNVVGCEAMLCAPGSYCVEDAAGNGSCKAYPTCATTKCASGSFCVDRPIVCVKAPCDPTAPSCETCPKPGTWINCMPSPDGVNALCGAKDSITANCPDVGFAY